MVAHRVERALEEAAAARVARLDPSVRSERGVVHTPWRLARFMAAQVDVALKQAGAARGLADDVLVLDPATGPGVFLAAAKDAGAGRALGLDLDADALAEARRILDACGLGDGVRLARHDTLAGPAPLDDGEAGARFRVVLGNPPWAGRSANRDATYTERLLDDFRREPDGRPLAEKKIGVLSDDYVRFWRWACAQVEGPGVVALVTNSSFLDGPVHRGMRACLERWFETITVVDLGGSSLVARSGERDENLFGVRVGAAVVVATRGEGAATIHRASVTGGSAAAKLEQLESDLAFEPVDPRPPHRAWTVGHETAPEYEAWPSLPELMPFHREGVQTNRDAFCIDADREQLRARLRDFSQNGGEQLGRAHLASGHYDPDAARAAIADADLDRDVQRLAYRPLDERWAALIGGVCHRPRPALLAAMRASSFALLTVRKDRGDRAWAHFGATSHPVDNCWLSSRSSCRTRAFPTHGPEGAPNLGEAARAWGFDDPEALVRYVLGVLAAPSYRQRYDAYLRLDYPRVPPPGEGRAAIEAAGEAVRVALVQPDDGAEPVVVGHRTVHARGLKAAIEAAEQAVRPLLERSRR